MDDSSKLSEVEVGITIAQSVQTQQVGMQQQQTIINPVKIIRSPYIPSALSLAISCVIIGLDQHVEHTFKIKIENNSTKELVFSSSQNQLNANPDTDNVVINADLKNIGFPNDGKYNTIIEVDHKSYSSAFYVFKADK